MVVEQDEKKSMNSQPNTNRVWRSFLERMNTRESEGPIENELSRFNSTSSAQTTTSEISAALDFTNSITVQSRLVDFFCVVQPDLETSSHAQQDLSFSCSTCPSEIPLQSRIVDCYPKTRDEFPHHIHTFCFPNACRVSTEWKRPTLFTLVLTSSNGHRLYGAVLTIHDESITLDRFHEALWLHSNKKEESCSTKESARPKKKLKKECIISPKEYYLPKCLVLISQHGFFSVFSRFLQQLYRIYASGASPLPLERYIANLVHDVPLPPLGRARVHWDCFTKDTCIQIARPAPNELPLVDFSYKPLFSCLSAANILVVWGVLLQEGRVVLCSQHHGLLTPVAEALLSLLFPLQWQGMYIPVLPSLGGMQDILEAPVPYLVGVDGKYLNGPRPAGVVFCDLDQDIVHLGYDDQHEPRKMPGLPDQEVMRLSVELEELADPLYLIPSCGIKGRMTTGDQQLLENSMREPYAQMTRLFDKPGSTDHRHFILSSAERAFVDGCEPLKVGDFLKTGKKELVRQIPRVTSAALKPIHRRDSRTSSVLSSLKRHSRSLQAHTDRVLAFVGQTYATPSPYVKIEADRTFEQKRLQIAAQLYDVEDGDGCSANPVRHTFLGFFTSLLFRYQDFLKANGSFARDAFLSSLKLSWRNRQYVADVVSAQMFERFLHDSTSRRKLFDEHIILKRNESAWDANKEPTPFLENSTRWKVQKVITPAAPCAIGVPKGKVYSYKSFPKLDEEEFVSRKTVDPWSALCDGAVCSTFLSLFCCF
jgi:hypothetical protein